MTPIFTDRVNIKEIREKDQKEDFRPFRKITQKEAKRGLEQKNREESITNLKPEFEGERLKKSLEKF